MKVNKKDLFIFSVSILVLSIFLYFKWQGRRVDAVVILITDDGFNPPDPAIKKGDRVIFRNVGSQLHWPASNLHPTHGVYPEFDPQKSIKPSEDWTFIFNKTGTWKYHDHLYPLHRGVITVE